MLQLGPGNKSQLKQKANADENLDDSEDAIEELKLSMSNDSSKDDTALLNGKLSPAPAQNQPQESDNVVQKSPCSTAAHSRQSSQASTISMEMKKPNSCGLGDCHKGLIVGLHRKMVSFFA